MAFRAAYLNLINSGGMDSRIERLYELERECRLCPRECKAKRLEGEVGICKAGAQLRVASAFPHFGEEPPLVGFFGSGTIFLSHCNLRCVFCQNYDISHEGRGMEVSLKDAAMMMLNLQSMGCHNINFVTPTHYAPQIVEAVKLAAMDGLELPLVWNCGGYESLEAVKLLDGIVDIYMPDIKYSSSASGKRYSAAPDYFDVARAAVKEMHRQVGDLQMDLRGIAQRGLLVRHLVMPGGVAGSEDVLRFLAEEISTNTYVNIMDQYRPLYKAVHKAEINRPITSDEYKDAVDAALRHELKRGF